METFDHDQQNTIYISDPGAAEVPSKTSAFRLPPENIQSLQASAAPITTPVDYSDNFLLAQLPEQPWEKLLPNLERVILSPDRYLYQPGDAVSYLYFPETAIVAEFQLLEDGRMLETALISSQGVSGLSASLSCSPANSLVQTLIAGSALRIRSGLFRREFTASEPLQRLCFNYLSDFIDQTAQRIICSTYHSVTQRYCRWLTMLGWANRLSKLALTQERSARNLGVHRPSLSNIANDLQSRGIISYRRGVLRILNFHELEKMACECSRPVI